MAISLVLWFWILATNLYGEGCESEKYTKGWLNKWSSTSNSDVLYGVLFADDLFLAYGRYSKEVSVDGGITWSMNGGESSSYKYFAAAYGAGKYILLGGDASINTLYLSINKGTSWTTNGNMDWRAYSLAYGNGYFITGGDSVSYKSSNADNWNPVPATSVLTGSWKIYDIIYDGGQFVGCGNGIYASDGTSWDRKYPTGGEATPNLHALAYDGVGKYVAVGAAVEGAGTVLSSSDGNEWTARNIADSGDLWGVAFGNGKFVAVNRGGIMYGSSDGINWKKQTNVVVANPLIDLGGLSDNTISNHLAFGKDVFVVVGSRQYIFVAEDNCACNNCDDINCVTIGASCVEDSCSTDDCSSCPTATSCATKDASCAWNTNSCTPKESEPNGGSGSVSPRPWAWFLLICLSIIIFH